MTSAAANASQLLQLATFGVTLLVAIAYAKRRRDD